MNISKFRWTLFKIFFSVSLVVWLFIRLKWSETLDVLRTVQWFVIVPGFLLFIFVHVFAASRLKLLLNLQKINISLLHSIRLNFISAFSSNFLPSTVGGDAIKILFLKKDGYSIGKTVATVITDRIIGLVSTTLLIPIPLFTLHFVERLTDISINLSVSKTNLFIVGMILSMIFIMYRYEVHRRISFRFILTIVEKIKVVVYSMFELASCWLKNPPLLFIIVCLSWSSILSSHAAAWIICRNMGIQLSFIDIVAVEILIYFISILPVTINGLGLQEAGRVYLLSLFGIEPVNAFALSILLRLIYMGTSLLGVLWIIELRNISWINKKT